jgi:hypothetical protein
VNRANSSRRATQVGWVVAGLVVISGLYILGQAFFVGCDADDSAHLIRFDPQAWREAGDDDPLWPTRLRMIDDLIASRRLDGAERSDVERLLGAADKTDKWTDWDLVYWLGPERGYVRIDSEWLVIRFDGTGHVATYRTVRD